jgi:DNA-binding MarR family transcriptional regulator
VATEWLTPEEDRAWRGWLAMSELLRTQIGRDLQGETGLSDADFAVLVHLSEAPGSRLRMSELAGALRWSKSRLSHQYARMEGRGLVRREGCPNDARSSFAALTPSGRREIERAAPLHVDSVRRHLIDLLDDHQLACIGEVATTVVAHLLALGAGREPKALPCPTRDCAEAAAARPGVSRS